MIVETFSAYKHRTHIYKIWALMSEYPDFKARYTAELTGKMLCGRDDILYNLHYIDDSFLEFRFSLPEKLAMGDALAVAYKVEEEKRKAKQQVSQNS